MISSRHYAYPQPYKPGYAGFNQKEADINANLDIGELPPIPKPLSLKSNDLFKNQRSSNSQEHLTMPLGDPLADILAESQKYITQYEVKLPSQRNYEKERYSHNEKSASHRYSLVSSISPFRSSVHDFPEDKPKSNISATNRAATKSKNTLQPKRLSFGANNEAPLKNLEANESISNRTGDPLACHADNIMRMAMDSTMLGYFCNDTISSSFSNVVDDSLYAKSFGEDANGKKAPKSTLIFSKAAKIDISARDLELAVSDPFKLP